MKRLIDDQQLKKLFAEYNMPHIEFDQRHILLMKNGSGEPIFNGKREEEQNYIADLVMKIIASFTKQQIPVFMHRLRADANRCLFIWVMRLIGWIVTLR